MKQVIFFFRVITLVTLVVFTLLMAGCKEDSDQDQDVLNSNWTINGKNYTALKTIYVVSEDALGAFDNEDITKAKNGILLFFDEKPTSSGAYIVIQGGEGDTPDSGEILIGIAVDEIGYISSGQNADYASVSILSSGRLKVTFNNITLFDDKNNKVKASGTIVEQ